MFTLFTGQTKFILPICASTNEEAMQLITQGEVKEGMLIRAIEQTAGKGQRGNSWQSDAGKNLTLSYILKPSFLTAAHQFWLSKAVALAVHDTLSDFNIQSEIKWPNDLLIRSKKIAGILIENTIKGNFLGYSVVGIGLNVNQEVFSGNLSATSLFLEKGQILDPETVMDQLSQNLEARYLQLKSGLKAKIDQEYHQVLFGKDKERQFVKGDEQISGKIIAVNDQGLLLLQREDKTEAFAFKEISFIL